MLTATSLPIRSITYKTFFERCFVCNRHIKYITNIKFYKIIFGSGVSREPYKSLDLFFCPALHLQQIYKPVIGRCSSMGLYCSGSHWSINGTIRPKIF